MGASTLHLLVILSSALAAPPPGPDARVDVERYVFRLELSDETDSIRGRATIDVRFRQSGVQRLSLDLVRRGLGGEGMTVSAVTVDGAGASFEHADDRITIPLTSPSRENQRAVVTVDYSGEPADGLIISTNKHGDRTFFGDNWPNRARHWLPVVDHPSDKALVEFIVLAPVHYQVVGSGSLVEETDLGDGRRLTHWRSNRPLATKVAVIGVARFAVDYLDVVDGVSVQSWVYPQDREAGFHDYELAEPVLRFFASRLGDYPYSKLANVQSKTRYGGMENASNIFYSENSVTGDRSSEGLIAHEVAHQWFGDSVTESDWPHVWLSEGFATYLTALYLEHTYGRDRFEQHMARDRRIVVGFSQRARQPIILDPPPDDLLGLLTPNSYQKGGWVLHMLRDQVGTETFWDGLREYYSRYEDGNASTDDFRDVMEDVSGQDLRWFFEQWLERPGHPVFRGGWSYNTSSGTLTIGITQTQDGAVFTGALDFAVYTTGSTAPAFVEAEFDEREEAYEFQVEADAVTDVRPDPRVQLLAEWTFDRR